MWQDWVEEGREVWDIARVCRNPFGRRERCGTLKDEGRTYDTDEEKFLAFVSHSLIINPAEPRRPVQARERTPADKSTIRRVEQALRRTRNNSAPGPGGISWELLKTISGTRLGRAIIEDVAQVVDRGRNQNARRMEIDEDGHDSEAGKRPHSCQGI